MVDATKSGGAFAMLAFAPELKLYQNHLPRAIGMGPEGGIGRSLSPATTSEKPFEGPRHVHQHRP